MTYPSPPERSEPAARPATPASSAPPQYSPDGRWYWDGQQWRPVLPQSPAWISWYAPPDARATAAVRLVGLTTAGLALFLVGEGLSLVAAWVAPGSVLDAVATVIQAVAFFASLAGFVGAAIAVPMWNAPVLPQPTRARRDSPELVAGLGGGRLVHPCGEPRAPVHGRSRDLGESQRPSRCAARPAARAMVGGLRCRRGYQSGRELPG